MQQFRMPTPEECCRMLGGAAEECRTLQKQAQAVMKKCPALQHGNPNTRWLLYAALLRCARTGSCSTLRGLCGADIRV